MKLFLFLLGAALSIQAFPQSQSSSLDSLHAIINNSKSNSAKAMTLVALTKYYSESNRDSSNYYLTHALVLSKSNKLYKTYADALLIKAQYFIISGNYDSSEYYYDATKEIIKELDDPETEATYNGDRGILNFYKGDFKAAYDYFSSALKITQENGLEEAELRFLNNQALAMSYLGEAEESIDVHDQAIKLAEKLQDSASLGRSLNNLGLIYEDMKEYEKALEFYNRSLEVKKKAGTEVDLINGLYNVAGMYKEIGERDNDSIKLEKARAGFNDVLLKGKEANYGKVVLFAKTGLAQIETTYKNYKKSIDIYLEVISEAEKLNDQQTLRVSYLNLGVNHLKLGHLGEAREALEKVKKGIEESENPSDKSKLYKNLSVVYEGLNQPEKALQFLKESFTLEASMSSERLQENISDLEIKYETEKKEREILKQRTEIAENQLEIRKKNNILYGSIGLIAIVGLLGYLFYSQQKLKHQQLKKENELQYALVKIETQNKLQEQRLRISRDLHDNVGSQLTFIISSIDNLKYGLKEADKKVTDKLGDIATFTKTTINELRDTIWAMNKESISFEDLQTRVSNFIDSARKASVETIFEFNIDPSISTEYSFSSVEGINLYRTIQEAINNSLKYASSSLISVDILQEQNLFRVSIKDNGIGFDTSNPELGNGLFNMKKRVKDVNGDFSISSVENEGTLISFSIPKS